MQNLRPASAGALAGCLLLSAPWLPVAGAQDDAILPAPSAPLVIRPTEEAPMTLMNVLDALGALGGPGIVVDEQTRQMLAAARVDPALDLEVPAEDACAFVESLLSDAAFFWQDVHDGEPRLLSVHFRHGGEGPTRHRTIEPNELERYARHPALPVQTVLQVKGVDVRTLSNSLRGMVTDPSQLSFALVGAADEQRLLLRGMGHDVAELARMLAGLGEVRALSAGGAGAWPVTGEDPFPVAREDLHVPGVSEGKSLSLHQLLARFAELTGQSLLLSEEVTSILDIVGVGLSRPVTVPAAQVHSFVEAVMIEKRFVMTETRPDEPRLISVWHLDSGARTIVLGKARTIGWEDLPIYERHPAFPVQTLIHLQHTDVRKLVNSLRSLVTSPNTLQIIPLGDSAHLLLRGFGPELAGMVRMLRRLDVESAPPAEDER